MEESSNNETQAILFNDLVPLPFRILGLIQLGLALWFFLNVILFRFTSLNLLQLLNLSYSPHKYTQLDGPVSGSGEFATSIPADRHENTRLISGIWTILREVTIVNTVSWVAFKLIQYFVNDWKLLYYGLLIVVFIFVLNRIFRGKPSISTPGQVRIWTTMKRVLRGGINSQTMRSNDILISDSLVSFAKVINDFGLFVWNYYIDENTTYNYKLEFAVLCIPTLIRIKQCWFEYKLTQQVHHLLNLIKYGTGFGPLVVNMLIKATLLTSSDEVKQSGAFLHRLNTLNSWWYALSALNSTYSFIWDIKMDWNLQLFNKLFNPGSKFHILRIHKSFPNGVYFIAIVIDFSLRFIWMLKYFIINEQLHESQIKLIHIFSTFLFGYDAYSFGYVVIELLEILRRWIWCFIKLESDWVKLRVQESGHPKQPAGDIELENIETR
ncbi:ERD1 [Candida theae]|uniref:ERD1 n=1 Tax=Candida theae TaxID=1198502 RepID=A0AAD5BF41_9ASCO|nr:ERD1 [Candida theae]KAI5958063.1 ERD1 [Candida theae]